MNYVQECCCLGIGVTGLFPEAFESDEAHLSSFSCVARLPDYDALETYLSLDKRIFNEEVRIAKGEGKRINYNFPIEFQHLGKFNPCSYDRNERRNAVELAKKHIDNAAKADSTVIILTSGPDTDPENRKDVLKLFTEYITAICDYSKQFGIDLIIETIERQRFKKLLLGPTAECVDYVLKLRNDGFKNLFVMVDTAHSPLMEENPVTALQEVARIGIRHIHIGNAILNESDRDYGHTHPALGVQNGCNDIDHLCHIIGELFRVGYLTREQTRYNKPLVSLEMLKYPGASWDTSAHLAYEKVNNVIKTFLN